MRARWRRTRAGWLARAQADRSQAAVSGPGRSGCGPSSGTPARPAWSRPRRAPPDGGRRRWRRAGTAPRRQAGRGRSTRAGAGRTRPRAPARPRPPRGRRARTAPRKRSPSASSAVRIPGRRSNSSRSSPTVVAPDFVFGSSYITSRTSRSAACSREILPCSRAPALILRILIRRSVMKKVAYTDQIHHGPCAPPPLRFDLCQN